MTALTINNLPLNVELDKAAMRTVLGGGRVGHEHLGVFYGPLASCRRHGRFGGADALNGQGRIGLGRGTAQRCRRDPFDGPWR